jgi:hypothetical protein
MYLVIEISNRIGHFCMLSRVKSCAVCTNVVGKDRSVTAVRVRSLGLAVKRKRLPLSPRLPAATSPRMAASTQAAPWASAVETRSHSLNCKCFSSLPETPIQPPHASYDPTCHDVRPRRVAAHAIRARRHQRAQLRLPRCRSHRLAHHLRSRDGRLCRTLPFHQLGRAPRSTIFVIPLRDEVMG